MLCDKLNDNVARITWPYLGCAYAYDARVNQPCPYGKIEQALQRTINPYTNTNQAHLSLHYLKQHLVEVETIPDASTSLILQNEKQRATVKASVHRVRTGAL